MALDKVILKHLESMDVIEDEATDMVEGMILKINIDDVIDDPQGVFMGLVNKISSAVQQDFYTRAGEQGLNLARTIEKDGKILLPSKGDSNLNEGLLEDD